MTLDVHGLRTYRQVLSTRPPDEELFARDLPVAVRTQIERLNDKPGIQVEDALAVIDHLLSAATAEGVLAQEVFEKRFSAAGVKMSAKNALDAAFSLGVTRTPSDMVRSTIGWVARGDLGASQRRELIGFLERQPERVLVDALGFRESRTMDERAAVVFRILFVRRGASPLEAEQQIMLNQRYSIAAVVTPYGEPLMWPDATDAATVHRALGENPDLAPRIRAYLEAYSLPGP